ncbi:hypothetical protein BDP55DRAFT_244441 [Colletotrichum godetiae]|uniref:Uncharacterized protein n=1 Tax=Colletotrichum godetiae TaxID=1209918 RepID=A0AAJ0EUY5_9PEZI|nr:uncharacterized protein BDP55DRAFT_244441 [Colletotrichum godetiae]KAK1672730.1 hypothetical protein BDP55DRAFT_244441 [Colletotrichum godetiae]
MDSYRFDTRNQRVHYSTTRRFDCAHADERIAFDPAIGPLSARGSSKSRPSLSLTRRLLARWTSGIQFSLCLQASKVNKKKTCTARWSRVPSQSSPIEEIPRPRKRTSTSIFRLRRFTYPTKAATTVTTHDTRQPLGKRKKKNRNRNKQRNRHAYSFKTLPAASLHHHGRRRGATHSRRASRAVLPAGSTLCCAVLCFQVASVHTLQSSVHDYSTLPYHPPHLSSRS